MSNQSIQPRTGSGLTMPSSPSALGQPSARISREISRTLARQQGAAVVRASQIEIDARLGEMKVSALSHVVRTAQMEAAMLSAAEQQLVLATPAASANVNYITQIGVLHLGQVVADSGVALRRA